jgi:small subunit ribosomal protein S16
MLTIRLQRVGKRNQPVFRIVLTQKHRAAQKQAVEILGHYNPHSKEFGIKDESRLKYWVAQHVQLSATVHNLFVTKGLVNGAKIQAWRPKHKATVAAAETEQKNKAPEAASPEASTESAKPEEKAPENTADAKPEEKSTEPVNA